MDSDQATTALETRLSTAYGAGNAVIPWAQIIATILSLLGGCFAPTPPTPALVRTNSKRFITKVKFMQRMHAQGIYGQPAEKVFAMVKVPEKPPATDETEAFLFPKPQLVKPA